MNQFEQHLRSIVPELNELDNVTIKTGSIYDLGLEVAQAIQQGQMPDPGDSFLMALCGGFSFAKDLNGAMVLNASQDIVSLLSDEETRAMVLHEIGHCKHGDLDNLEGQVGHINVVEKELAADRYAMDRGVTSEVMLSALHKVSEHSIRKFIGWKAVLQNQKINFDAVEASIRELPEIMKQHEAARYNAIVSYS